VSNTKRCPFCKGWIPLPIRNVDAAFEKHKKACNPEGYKQQVAYGKELLGGNAPDLLAPPEEMTVEDRAMIHDAMIGETIEASAPLPVEERDLRRQETDAILESWIDDFRNVAADPNKDTIQEPDASESSLTSPDSGKPVGLYTIYVSDEDWARIARHIGKRQAKKEDVRDFAYSAIRQALKELD
jgi:hypothetical protein